MNTQPPKSGTTQLSTFVRMDQAPVEWTPMPDSMTMRQVVKSLTAHDIPGRAEQERRDHARAGRNRGWGWLNPFRPVAETIIYRLHAAQPVGFEARSLVQQTPNMPSTQCFATACNPRNGDRMGALVAISRNISFSAALEQFEVFGKDKPDNVAVKRSIRFVLDRILGPQPTREAALRQVRQMRRYIHPDRMLNTPIHNREAEDGRGRIWMFLELVNDIVRDEPYGEALYAPNLPGYGQRSAASLAPAGVLSAAAVAAGALFIPAWGALALVSIFAASLIKASSDGHPFTLDPIVPSRLIPHQAPPEEGDDDADHEFSDAP